MTHDQDPEVGITDILVIGGLIGLACWLYANDPRGGDDDGGDWPDDNGGGGPDNGPDDLSSSYDTPQNNELPQRSGAVIGACTAEEAERWIAEYRNEVEG